MKLVRASLVVGILLASAANGRSASSEDAVKGDARLDTKITLELGLVTLEKLAKEVSKQTGVTIKASDRQSDWQVKERKTVVYAKDVPARGILLQVAELHRYLLSRYGKKDDPPYFYWQDAKSKKEQQELHERAKTRPYEEYASAMDEMAKAYGASDSMTPDDLAKLEESDPYKHYLLTDPLGRAICGIAAQIPQNTFDQIDTEEWRLSMDSANPALAEAIQRYMEEARKLNPERFEGKNLEVSSVILDVELETAQREFGVVGRLEFEGCEFPLVRPGSFGREVIGRTYKAARAGTYAGATSMEQLGIKKPELLNGDPVLKEKVKIASKDECDYAAWLRAVYEKTGLTMLSDSYWEEIRSGISGELSVQQVLERVVSLGKTPSKEGSTLVISDNLWYEKRATEIRDSYLEYYKNKAETVGLKLDDLKQLALDLSLEQIRQNLLCRDAFREYGFFLANSRQLGGMRLIACLTDRQKKAIEVDRNELMGGVDLSSTYELPAEELPRKALQYALEAAGKDAKYIAGRTVTFSHYAEPKPLLGGMQSMSVRMNLVDREGNKETRGISIQIPGSDWFERTKPKTPDQK